MHWDLVLLSLVFVPGIFLRLAPFKDLINKKQKIRLCIAHPISLVLNFVALVFASLETGISVDIVKIDFFIFGFLISLINIIIIKGYAKEHLFTCGMILSQDFILLSIVAFMVRRFIPWYGTTMYAMCVSIGCLISQLILYWFFHKLIVSTVKPFLTLQEKNYWNGIWYISAIMFLSCFFTMPLMQLVNSKYIIITRIFQYIVIVVICRTMGRDSLAIKEKMELEKGLSLQQNHYMELANRIEDARRIRHDFKHRITTMHQYLQNEDYDGLKKYCDELQSSSQTDVSIPYTGNPAVDGIMYHYASISKENGISFEYKKINPPQISDVDLCTLLGNALDNAVTACKNVKENPFIQVISNGEGEGMQVLIRNSYDGIIKKNKEKFLTRKSEGDHGIGISSMQEICDRNDILMKIAYTDNTFDVLFVF